MMRVATWFSMLLMCSNIESQAGVITSLYSTGVNDNGSSAAIKSADLHYEIYSSTDYNTGNPILQSTTAYVMRDVPGSYVVPPQQSQWIAPSFLGVGFAIGWYDFRTTFDLTGFDPATVKITGQMAMDNETRGPGLILNGVDTDYVIGVPGGGETSSTDDNFVRLSPFSVTSGFQSGLNTLDFRVFNTGGPVALLVEMNGTGVNSVPEPSSLLLVGVGVLSISVMARKSQKSVLIPTNGKVEARKQFPN